MKKISKVILVVDDHEAIVDALEILLEDEFQVVTATSVPEALEVLEFLSPDLIILDCLMPGFNGMQFLREIRQMNLPSKVVIITGSSSEQIEEEVRWLGIDGFIPKPFDLDRIMGYALAV